LSKVLNVLVFLDSHKTNYWLRIKLDVRPNNWILKFLTITSLTDDQPFPFFEEMIISIQLLLRKRNKYWYGVEYYVCTYATSSLSFQIIYSDEYRHRHMAIEHYYQTCVKYVIHRTNGTICFASTAKSIRKVTITRRYLWFDLTSTILLFLAIRIRFDRCDIAQ